MKIFESHETHLLIKGYLCLSKVLKLTLASIYFSHVPFCAFKSSIEFMLIKNLKKSIFYSKCIQTVSGL